MTLDQAIKQLEKVDPLKKFGKDFMKYVAIRINTNLLARMKKRVQDTGVSSTGSRFKPYSTKNTLIGYSTYPLYKRAYPRLKAEAKKSDSANWVTINGHKLLSVTGGYKRIRDVAGYQTGHKDFTVTGTMFRMIKVKDIQIQGTSVLITYGGTDRETEQKLAGHDSREGINIILPSKQEIKELEDNIEAWLTGYIKDIFNGKK